MPSSSRPASTAVVPRATYRLQLHHRFDFQAAERVLPYLQRLGISHVYCSPISRARTGSLHGYDVVDHGEISPELGGRKGFERFAAAARAHGLGLVLDLVPNHMGVIGADNPWWSDVLENGQASAFAGYFDINWHPFNRELEGKVLVPVLGACYGEILDQGQLQLAFEPAAGQFALHYFDHRFPVDPATWPPLLRAAAAAAQDDVVQTTLEALAVAAAAVPGRDNGAPDATARRTGAIPLLKRSLADLVATGTTLAAQAMAAIDSAISAINTDAGHDALHALHEAQAYRLGFWHVAADEINYRRFFDVNDLAALRIEDERVFEATHALALDLAAAGTVDGLRIDHPDGLRDPAQYFVRLQQAYACRVASLRADINGETADATAAPNDSFALYVVAEKITASHEDLPDDWALHGTTGYRYGMLVNGLFVDRRQASRFDRIWRSFSGVANSFEDMVYAAKRAVAFGALGAELTVLATQLKRIANANRRTRDFGFNTLRDAIAEAAAGMPVYRTYVVEKASAQDLRFIDWAISNAKRRSAFPDTSVFDFLRSCMVGEAAAGGSADTEGPGGLTLVRQFAWRFQQFCAPVAAKGVEDTAFYRYHRLISLNEVGGDPASFGITVQAFHGASADRAARWPHTMLATSTHDNKRSEDVRCRIDVLSEVSGAWRLGLRRWHTLTRSHRQERDDVQTPSRADEFMLYQTLLGSLPTGELDDESLATYRERIAHYMVKAAREAKRETSWMRPDAAYEEALLGLVRGVLGRITPNPVLTDLRARAADLAWFGGLNSLSMTVLKFTSPGVPDLYQGNELIDLSLVDPDNRRPVDYDRRARLLDELHGLIDKPDRAAALARIAQQPTDDRLKLWATWRLLALRSRDPAVFAEGDYMPLRVTGSARDHVVAYARRTPQSLMIVVVGRLFAKLLARPGEPFTGEACWGDTTVDASALLSKTAGAAAAHEVMTHTTQDLGGGRIRMADVLTTMPAAVFWITT